ncbi:MAG: hypothetical protein SWZ49_14965 [Cyanobacteriota bacterium]|nr:hypothetical protein [Cyanobacteriota bacterium]
MLPSYYCVQLEVRVQAAALKKAEENLHPKTSVGKYIGISSQETHNCLVLRKNLYLTV